MLNYKTNADAAGIDQITAKKLAGDFVLISSILTLTTAASTLRTALVTKMSEHPLVAEMHIL